MSNTPTYEYDLLVIGAGSGGVRAARMSAQAGARVAVCEESRLGGTCVNVGCVPKKLLVYGSEFSTSFQQAEGFGWQVPPTKFDWATLIANKDREITRLNGVYGNLLENAGVEVIPHHATLTDAHTVIAGGRSITAERILIATGSRPFLPSWSGVEHAITSNEAFYLPDLPKRVIVCGGGYIAVEFAGILNGMGAEVTQLYRGPLFMREFDDDLRQSLSEEMTKRGIHLRFGCNIAQLEKTPSGLLATLSDGSQQEVDQVLLAIGRTPNTEGLGLKAVGVETDDTGAIIVGQNFQTNVPSIYAIGDVIGGMMLTPVALAEGMALARYFFQGATTAQVDYTNIPTAVFSQPNLGTVGLTEAEAREKFARVKIFRSSFTPMKQTLAGGNEKSLMKLVVDDATDKVVGCHMVGSDAGEIIQGFAVALQCGATKAQFDATIGIHPTAAEEFVTMREPVD